MAYRELESITTKGSNIYYDTGIPITKHTRIRFKFQKHTGNSGYDWGNIIGNLNGDKVSNWSFRGYGSERTLCLQVPVTDTTRQELKLGYEDVNTIYTVECGNHYIIDETNGNRVDATPVDFSDRSYTMRIGNDIVNSPYSNNVTYYWVQVFNGEDLVADLIPVINNYRPAFYNKVDGTFFYSTDDSKVTYTNLPVVKNYTVLNNDKVILKPYHSLEEGKKISCWNDVKSIDFGGANVEFSGHTSSNFPYRSNPSITAIKNGTITNSYTSNMFQSCGALAEFDCQCPNTTNANYMFYGSGLQTANLDFPSATQANYVCHSNTKLKDVNINMPNVTSMEYAFSGCSALTTVTANLPKLNNGQNSLFKCGFSGWSIDLPALTNGKLMFSENKTLKEYTGLLPVLNNGDSMFRYCTALSQFNVAVPNLSYTPQMFERCSSLVSVSLGDTSKLSNASRMFNGCGRLATVNMSVSGITAWDNMFDGCTNLVNWNIKDLGVETSTLLKPKVTSFDYIANNAKTVSNGEWFVMTDAQYANYPTAVATLQNKGWNVYKESNYPQERTSTYAVLLGNGSFRLNGQPYSNAVEGVKKWIALPDATSAITSVGNAFSGNANIFNIMLDIPNVTDGSSMFKNCGGLTSFSGNLDSLRVGGQSYPEYGMFTSCFALTSFTTNNLDNLVSGSAMFRNTKLTVFPYDMPNLVNGVWMFTQNSKSNLLTEFHSDLRKLTHSSRMFQNQDGLVKFTSPIPSLLDDYSSANNGFMFDGCTHLTDFMVAELPVSVMTLNLSFCPVNYDSFVYMAERNEQVVSGATNHCTLRLSNTSKALSSTTDVAMYWNLLDAKGYRIEGYTADHTYLPENWYIDEEGIVRLRSGYTVTFSSEDQSVLDAITVVVDGDNNNTNITV